MSDENSLTEIHLASDGRVYLFGASAAVLEVIWAAEIADDSMKDRIAHLRGVVSHVFESDAESSRSASI
jgi:hypothetical protein